jgi:hypothetical protein
MISIMRRNSAVVVSLCAGLLLIPAAVARTSHGDRRLEPAAVRIPQYGVFERTFRWPSAGYSNPWEEVSLAMTVVSPAGARTTVGGFYVAPDTWKARFAPAQTGRWRWVATLRDASRRKTIRGTFTVRASGPGFVRRSPHNRFRWAFADGSPYYPIGIGDCVRDRNRSGSPFDAFAVDTHRTTLATYLAAHHRAGLNLFRWSVDNCAFGLYRSISPDGNVYLEREGSWGDHLVRELRSHGFRVYMSIFGFDPPFAGGATREQLAAVKRYVKYVVDRYGPYVDYWELMNEARATTDWYMEIARYLRGVDPYRHPIGTSWERPDLEIIDVNSPHWYEKEAESESDARTWSLLMAWKAAGKPVIVGEQGNSGQNWDDRSGVRMRLRAWTALFAEGALIFWNTSTTKSYRSWAANIYLGPEERRYLRVLRNFTRGFDARARIVSVRVSGPPGLRGYGLSGPREYAAYLHASQNHGSTTRGARLRIRSTTRGTAAWIDPGSGRTLARRAIQRGLRELAVPAFTTDVALKIRFRRGRN